MRDAPRSTNGRRWVVGVLLAAAAAGLLTGAALAGGERTPAGVASSPDGRPGAAARPDYPTNARGQTYGSLNDAVLPEDEPDLIRVQASNGRQGYVEKEVLDAVTGANVSSPEEAIAWQAAQDAATSAPAPIPVYESDGRTVVGSFEISRSERGGPRNRPSG